MMCAYTQVHYGPMVVFVCLHIKLPRYHHYADLSEGIELLKCLSGNSVSSMCIRFSQFSQLSFVQYMGLCLLSLPIPLVIVWIRILFIIIIIRIMVHLPLFRVWSWNNGMRCMNVYILTRLWYRESISNKDTAFQEMLIFGKSWNVTWFQLKAHKMFAIWALGSWINDCDSASCHTLNRFMIIITV